MKASYPLLLVAISLLAGLLISKLIGSDSATINFLWVCVLSVFVFIQYLSIYLRRWHLSQINCLIFFCLFGYSLNDRTDLELSFNHFSNYEYQKLAIECIKPIKENKIDKWLVKVVAIQDSTGHWKSSRGKVILHIRNNTQQDLYGYQFLTSEHAIPFSYNRNPKSFCYHKYLKNEFSVYHNLYTSIDQLTLLSIRTFSWQKLMSQARINLQFKFDNSFDNLEHSAIMQAMLLGQKHNLNEIQKSSFRNAGVFHLLAVSGLHVGILCSLLIFIIYRLIPINSTGTIIRGILIHGILWLYIFLTGAPPSAVRAGIMCSTYLIGKSAGLHISSINIVCAVFIVMLVLHPYNIDRIGFQFSFLALMGILLFSPSVIKLNTNSSKPLNYIWLIIAISCSAQLGVAPLSIYYFKSFPNYFILSNIFSTPLTGLIICSGILHLILSFVPLKLTLANTLGEFIGLLLEGFSWMVSSISGLPFAVIQNINIHQWQVWGVYFNILILFAWIKTKNPLLVFTSFISINAFIASCYYSNYIAGKTATITVYEKKYKSCADLAYRDKILNLHSSFPDENQYYLNSNWRKFLTSHSADVTNYDLSNYSLNITFKNHQYLFYPDCNEIAHASLQSTRMIINDQVWMTCIDEILKFKPTLLILDSTILPNELMRSKLHAHDQKYYSVIEKGPFIEKHYQL